jgi:hypothetical protein
MFVCVHVCMVCVYMKYVWSVYVRMYAYMCTCMYAYMYARMYAFMYVIHVCMYVFSTFFSKDTFDGTVRLGVGVAQSV